MSPPSGKGGQRPDATGSLAEVGQVTAELLHDLSGIMGRLEGRIALARQDAEAGQIPSVELERIDRDCRRLRAMVHDVMGELAGATVSPEEPFDLERCVYRVVEEWLPAAPFTGISVSSALSGGTAVKGRPSFFERALLNLLRNAARHARSEIRIALYPQPREDRPGAVVVVEDDGEGVADEIRPHAFEPFVTGEEDGTGLGLSVVRWSVERLGGRVAYSVGDHLGGAAFHIWLPTGTHAPAEKGGRAGGSHRPAHSLRGLSITVVDDDPAIRRVYRRLLDRAGAEVRELDPARPRDLVRTLLDDPADVVILDVNLGVACGVDLWDRIHEHAPERAERTLLLTGDDSKPGSDEEGRPMASKLADWDELTHRIHDLVRPEG